MAGRHGREGAAPLAESALYPAVKRFLEELGYEAKGELRGCDIVACRGAERPLVVELKLALNLDLVLQGVERLAIAERVYLAVPASRARLSRVNDRRVRTLLRMLGLGLLAVEPGGAVTPLLDPAPYQPRRNAAKEARLVDEHRRRAGDPNPGGLTRRKLVTAYRQEALRCAAALAERGTASPAELRRATGVAIAGRILGDDFYGWFERVERGRYRLSAGGEKALQSWAGVLASLPAAAPAIAAAGQ